jgi:DNA-binding HxlR family transcriptional regulator
MLTKDELPECPVATTVCLIGNKWKPLIIRDLLNGAQRFKYLQFGIKGISAKVLSENLKQMEEDGLVKREVFDEIPLRVEYSLTELGEQMRPIILALADWGKEYKKIKNQL